MTEAKPPFFLEDVVPGSRYLTRSEELTERAIVDFAAAWDPQPFHLDRVAAEASYFGGLVASGLHVLSLSFKLYNELGLFEGTAVAGAGLDELRWRLPSRLGDRLRVEATLAGARRLGRPDRGLVSVGFRTLNQDAGAVMTATLHFMVRTRPQGADATLPC